MKNVICDYCGKNKDVTLLNYPMGIYTYICDDCKLKGKWYKKNIYPYSIFKKVVK